MTNLYDGLDWYNIPDRTFSRSVPLRINHNVPIPVLLVDEGNVLLVGGTSGAIKVLNTHTAETIQTLDHTRVYLISSSLLTNFHLCDAAEDLVQALVWTKFR